VTRGYSNLHQVFVVQTVCISCKKEYYNRCNCSEFSGSGVELDSKPYADTFSSKDD